MVNSLFETPDIYHISSDEHRLHVVSFDLIRSDAHRHFIFISATMENGSFFIQLVEITDESVQVIKWEGLWSVLVITFVAICCLVTLFSKSLMLIYIKFFAPKARPINKMIFWSTVRSHMSPWLTPFILGLEFS